MMSGRILNRWSAFIFVKCVWADNMTQYFLCRCKDHAANSGYTSDSFLWRTGTLFQSKALLFGSLKSTDVEISDLKSECFAKIYINTLKEWPNMGKVPLPCVFPTVYLIFFMANNVWFFFSWFSLAWVAAGPSLCLLDIISGVYLAIHVLLGDSHHPVADGSELSPPPKRQVGIFEGTCMWFSQKYQKTPLSPSWQPPCPAVPSLSSLYGMYSVWHVLWEIHKARHGLWMLLLCNSVCPLLPYPLLY